MGKIQIENALSSTLLLRRGWIPAARWHSGCHQACGGTAGLHGCSPEKLSWFHSWDKRWLSAAAAVTFSRCSQLRSILRSARCRVARTAVPVVDLLPPGTQWPELDPPLEGLQPVVADLTDMDRCLELVAEVFDVKSSSANATAGIIGAIGASEEPGEYRSVSRGLAARLGGSTSIIGADAATPTASLARPIPVGSAERPELGLVLAYVPADSGDAPCAALVDISLWPSDGRVRAPDARSKPGTPSEPYMLNLCVSPNYRRQGLARALLQLSERIVCDIWGDRRIFLHVEDDKVPANTLYEATGYEALGYEYDPLFPYSKSEAKVLRTVTYRCKELKSASPQLEVVGDAEVEQERELITEDQDESEDKHKDTIEQDAERGEEAAAPVAIAEEDYSWVKQLIK